VQCHRSLLLVYLVCNLLKIRAGVGWGMHPSARGNFVALEPAMLCDWRGFRLGATHQTTTQFRRIQLTRVSAVRLPQAPRNVIHSEGDIRK
jgi:hypothetical protein